MAKSKLPVDVVSKQNAYGQDQPLRFAWKGKIFEIQDTGRRWTDDAGEHILVMTREEQTFELIHSASKELWQIRPIHTPGRV